MACAALAAALTGCARSRAMLAPTPAAGGAAEAGANTDASSASCPGCDGQRSGDEVLHAVALRVADLLGRGGSCQAYGAVLEGSLAARRIVVRPYMWRVGASLASAQALQSGEIDVAREVDALNVGVRSLDDVVHSVEHEAVHIAFAIPSGQEWTESLVNERVGECRPRSARVGTSP